MHARRIIGTILVLAGMAFALRGGLWLLVAAALAVTGIAFFRGRSRLVERSPAPAVPIPPVPVAEVADLVGPVTACPRCGFVGIRPMTIGDGLWPGGGETDARRTCPRCLYIGLPIEFETAQEYAMFLRGLSEDPSQTTSRT